MERSFMTEITILKLIVIYVFIIHTFCCMRVNKIKLILNFNKFVNLENEPFRFSIYRLFVQMRFIFNVKIDKIFTIIWRIC